MPDRLLSLFKALNKPKIAQEFDEITGSRLQDFILELARKNDSKIERNAAELLAEYTEGDLWRIENEVNKLANFTSGKITSEAVQEIVGRNLIGDIFVLIELIARGSKSKAIKQLENLLENGEPPLKILAMVNYQIRSLCLIKEASEQITNSFAISKKTGLSPFQVSKLIGVAKDFDWQALSQMYRLLANFDSAIKTGKIEAGEALKELVLDI
jgi:DNA polymerase-3 subunit delta